jgi:uroporphyrinogen-III decarboxylase
MKKIIALILALALVLTSGATVFAQASSPVAIPEDVKGFSYEEAVTALIEKGIVVGETDGLFHPYDTLTRAQACIMIVKAMNAPAIQAAGTQSTAHNQFKDMAGYTDIFKAKQILGNHSCILGDVPPTLFTLGSPDQVTSYCNALLSEFKNDGGFILGSGCTVPYNSKHENVKAFFEASSKF